MNDSLSAEVARGLAAHHLENLKVYAAKARECREAGREDLAALFRTFALHSGRQWLALVWPNAHRDWFHAVTNLEFSHEHQPMRSR